MIHSLCSEIYFIRVSSVLEPYHQQSVEYRKAFHFIMIAHYNGSYSQSRRMTYRFDSLAINSVSAEVAKQEIQGRDFTIKDNVCAVRSISHKNNSGLLHLWQNPLEHS